MQSGVKIRLKAMAIRSNFHELQAIAAFCCARTKVSTSSFRLIFTLTTLAIACGVSIPELFPIENSKRTPSVVILANLSKEVEMILQNPIGLSKPLKGNSVLLKVPGSSWITMDFEPKNIQSVSLHEILNLSF
jgi:hypothetical protein